MAITITNGFLSDLKTTTQTTNLQLSDLVGKLNLTTSGGGGSELPSDCIEFTVDTTDDNTSFEMEVGTSMETNYTITWGDTTTDSGVLMGYNVLNHNYPASDTQYVVRLCFDGNASNVTSLEFIGND